MRTAIAEVRHTLFLQLDKLKAEKQSAIKTFIEQNVDLSRSLENYLGVDSADARTNFYLQVSDVSKEIYQLIEKLDTIFFIVDKNIEENIKQEVDTFLEQHKQYFLKHIHYLIQIDFNKNDISLLHIFLFDLCRRNDQLLKQLKNEREVWLEQGKKIIAYENDINTKSSEFDLKMLKLYVSVFALTDDSSTDEINRFRLGFDNGISKEAGFDKEYKGCQSLLSKLKSALSSSQSPSAPVLQNSPPARSFTPPPSRIGAVTPQPPVTPLQTRYYNPCFMPAGDGFSPPDTRAPTAPTR